MMMADTNKAKAAATLPYFQLGEPLSVFNQKLNNAIDALNTHSTSLDDHGEVLKVVNEQILVKLERKPYFFNVTKDMTACTYLKEGDAAMVLGDTSIDDGKMKLYRIVSASDQNVNGTTVIQLTGVTGLVAVYTPETMENELRTLINTNATNITNIGNRVAINSLAITPSASFASTKTRKGLTRNYYKLPVTDFTANTKVILKFDPAQYTEAALKEVKAIVSHIIDIDTVAGGIEVFTDSNLDLKSYTLYFTCITFFNT
ncbi:MAG: hypothetical protein NC548_19960 [Lachnospiraceae bacterium]|nr:hypothetical protein [Lachnospiraceae bacterium]